MNTIFLPSFYFLHTLLYTLITPFRMHGLFPLIVSVCMYVCLLCTPVHMHVRTIMCVYVYTYICISKYNLLSNVTCMSVFRNDHLVMDNQLVSSLGKINSPLLNIFNCLQLLYSVEDS